MARTKQGGIHGGRPWIPLPFPPESKKLLAACAEGSLEDVRRCLDEGADIDCKTQDRRTPLTEACKGGHKDVVSLLLDRGTAINSLDQPLLIACALAHKDIVFMLLERGANINTSNTDGWTCLHHACDSGLAALATLLLDRGSAINAADDQGWTSLHKACYRGHKDVAALLLDRGASIDKADKMGRTALYVACYGGHKELVALLLGRGAHFKKKNEDGKTPLDSCREWDHQECAALLLEAANEVPGGDGVEELDAETDHVANESGGKVAQENTSDGEEEDDQKVRAVEAEMEQVNKSIHDVTTKLEFEGCAASFILASLEPERKRLVLLHEERLLLRKRKRGGS